MTTKETENKIDFYNQVSMVSLLDAALISHNNELYGGVREKSPLRPSSAGKCERQLAYEYSEFHRKENAVLEEKEGNVVRLLGLGHHIERSLINDLYKLKPKFGIHVKYRDQIVTCGKLKNGTLIQGEIDYCLESDDMKMLCDAKSTKNKFSSHMKDSWDDTSYKWAKSPYVNKISEYTFVVTDIDKFVEDLGDDFKNMNILQLNLYAHSPFLSERGYEWCALHYYLKNDSRIFELRFKKSKKLYDKVMKKYQSAYDNGQKDPNKAEKTFHFGSIRCAFCAYNERCWSETTDPKYAYFQSLPKKYWPKDIDKIKESKKISELFAQYENALTESEAASKIELEIAKALYDQKVGKIKLENGNVYQVKTLKSQGLVLRRSKI